MKNLVIGILAHVDAGKTTLTEQMLHGVYTLNNKESGLKAFRKQTPFQELTFPGGTYSMTVLPTAVYFGSQYVTCSGTGYKYSNLKYLEGHEVAVVEFAMEDKLGFMPAIYELQGNTVVFRHIETSGFKADDFSWQLSGVELSFDITLTGPYITFATGDHTVQLMAYALSENPESLPTLRGYSLPDSALVAGLDFFSCNNGYVYGADRTGTMCYLLLALLGVSDADLKRDYELTALYYGYVSPELMDRFVERIGNLPGNSTRERVEFFLESAGVTQAQMDSIRQIFLG